MGVEFSNNASTLLTNDILDSDLSFDVDDVSEFPDVSGGDDYMYLTLVSVSAIEIIKVTSVSGNTLTCVRAQDNTAASAFTTGDRCDLRVCTAMLTDALAEVNADSGLTAISNIAGTNTITGTGSPTITFYKNGESYVFTALNAITGPVTLNWNGVGAKALVYDGDVELFKNLIIANQTIVAIYNSTNDNFEWRNSNRKVRYGNKGSDIASASTVDLSLLEGNQGDISGVVTVTSFGTTPAGTIYYMTATGAFQITHNGTSNKLPGQANYTTTAGDMLIIQSLGSGNNQIWVFPFNGRALVEPNTIALRHQSNTTNAIKTGVLFKSGWGFINGTGASRMSESVTFPIAFATELLSVNISFIGMKVGSDPSTILNFGTTTDSVIEMRALTNSLSEFTAEFHTDATFTSGTRYGYSWIATGN